MDPGSSIYVAGHRGMVGAALLRKLQASGHSRVLTRTRGELDLQNASAVQAFFAEQRPKIVVVAAARVGGIVANRTYPVEFMEENLGLTLNLIRAAHTYGADRLLFLGSSCIYPRDAHQPIAEDELLASPLESTNEAYALAKICGLKLCQYYRRQYGKLFHSAMPTNLYGPGDNYHLENSHVLPALIRKFHEARGNDAPRVILWGSGSPRREFLHVDDLAEAILHLLDLPDPPDWINVGTGVDVTIRELAELVAEQVGYRGAIEWDTSRPDGTPRKLLDVSRIAALGWRPSIELREGIARTYRAFLDEVADGSLRL